MALSESPREERLSKSFRLHEREGHRGISIGSCLPQTFLTNAMIEEWGLRLPDGKPLTADLIERTTGVKERSIAAENETVVSMGIAAAQDALKGRRDVDVILLSSSHPENVDFARAVAQGLGLSIDGRYLWNFHAACSGIPRAFAFVKEREHDFHGRNILIIASEKYSPYLQDLREGIEKDLARSQTIFSDGAFALFGTYGEDFEVISPGVNYFFGKDSANLLRMAIYPERMRGNVIFEPREHPIPIPESGKLEMQGPAVLKEVIKTLPDLIRGVLKRDGHSPSDVLINPHQASGRIIDNLSERLPEYTLVKDVEEGNFSSGSILKALDKARREGKIPKSSLVVLAGVGAGLFASIVTARFIFRN